MNVQHVPTDFIHQVWPDVEEFLASALKKHGEVDGYTTDAIRTLLSRGAWMLIVVSEEDKIVGAMTVEFMNRPSQRVAFVTCMGGKTLANPDVFEKTKHVFKMFGATHTEGAVNESAARLFEKIGLTEKYRIVGAAL